MMNRIDKLKKLDESRVAKEMVIISNGEPFIAALKDKITELKDALGVGVELNNLDELVESLGQIETLKEPIAQLHKEIAIMKIPEMPKTVKIEGLDSLLKALQILSKKKDVHKVDISTITPITDQVGNLITAIESIIVPKQGQEPGDYIPMRRVVLVGRKLMYDDSFYTGGGGGGAGVTPPTMLYQPIIQSGAGTTNLIGGVASKRIKVTNYVVVMGGAGTLKFQSDINDITGAMSFGANGGVSVGGTEFSPAFQTGAGEGLNMVTTSATGNGHIAYFFE